MTPVAATFADLLKAFRNTVASLTPTGLVKVGLYNPARRSGAMYGGTDVFIVSVGPDWSWPDGEATGAEGDSVFVLEGDLVLEYWHRDERDEAQIAEAMLTDQVLGVTGPLYTLLSKLNDDGGQGYATLQDWQGNTPLFRPLIFKSLHMPNNIDTGWRAFVLTFNCQFKIQP